MKTRRIEVALDVDGILANFVQCALDYVHRHSGRKYDPSHITTWELFETIEEKHLQADCYDMFKAKGGCTSIPVFEGAQEGVRRLQQIADVFFVTSPFRPSQTWMVEREEWLYRHFHVKAKDVVHNSQKHRTAADVFVDDKAEHVLSWQERHPTGLALLWNTPHNQKEPLLRTTSWGSLLVTVQKRIEVLGFANNQDYR